VVRTWTRKLKQQIELYKVSLLQADKFFKVAAARDAGLSAVRKDCKDWQVQRGKRKPLNNTQKMRKGILT
jgi:hypothetical protein